MLLLLLLDSQISREKGRRRRKLRAFSRRGKAERRRRRLVMIIELFRERERMEGSFRGSFLPEAVVKRKEGRKRGTMENIGRLWKFISRLWREAIFFSLPG